MSKKPIIVLKCCHTFRGNFSSSSVIYISWYWQEKTPYPAQRTVFLLVIEHTDSPWIYYFSLHPSINYKYWTNISVDMALIGLPYLDIHHKMATCSSQTDQRLTTSRSYTSDGPAPAGPDSTQHRPADCLRVTLRNDLWLIRTIPVHCSATTDTRRTRRHQWRLMRLCLFSYTRY
jgi:hypothetical protein